VSTTIKQDLHEIAEKLPETASYSDAMNQLYVRMKVAEGKKAFADGNTVSHDEVKARFSK